MYISRVLSSTSWGSVTIYWFPPLPLNDNQKFFLIRSCQYMRCLPTSCWSPKTNLHTHWLLLRTFVRSAYITQVSKKSYKSSRLPSIIISDVQGKLREYINKLNDSHYYWALFQSTPFCIPKRREFNQSMMIERLRVHRFRFWSVDFIHSSFWQITPFGTSFFFFIGLNPKTTVLWYVTGDS